MMHTVLERVGGSGGIYKAEFEGEGTRFVPVCSEEQLMGKDEEVAGKEEGGGGGAAKAPPAKRRVVNYTEGLVHRLALVEEMEAEQL